MNCQWNFSLAVAHDGLLVVSNFSPLRFLCSIGSSYSSLTSYAITHPSADNLGALVLGMVLAMLLDDAPGGAILG